MRRTLLEKARQSIFAALGLLTTAALETANGQTPEEPAQTVPVEIDPMIISTTGLTIPQSEAATSLPVSTYTEEAIRQTGATTVTQFLQTIPQNTGARFRETVATGLSFVPGASAIALRGLNVNATLVLLNGRRVAPFALAQNGTDQFVDINSIPLAAIDRIEILHEGASAIYGSDAIAGVVNIITKQQFSGTEVFSQYGNTTRSDDMGQTTASMVSGLTVFDGKFRLMLSASFYQQNPLGDVDRDFSRTNDHRRQGGTDQRSVRANPGTFITPFGPLRPPPGTDGQGLTPTDFLPGINADGSPVNRYNYNQRSQLIPSSQRAGYYGTLEFDLTKHITLFLEGIYQDTLTKEQAAPTPVDSIDDLSVGPANPYNPFGVRLPFFYRLLDFDNRTFRTESEFFRYLSGIRIHNLPNNWRVEIAALQSENKVVTRGSNLASKKLVQETLDASDPDKAFNPFADGPGFQRGDVLDSFQINTTMTGRSELRLADVRASGDLFSLPAGAIGLGVGLEYREEELSVAGDRHFRNFDVVSSGNVSAEGARSSKGAYFQVDIPVTSPVWNVPGLHALNILVAGRYDEFTDFGSVFKPKFSLRYQPVSALTFRASYQEGFRAPSLSQLFLGDVVGFEPVIDPANPGRGTVDTQVISGGNPALQPETSYGYSAGFVLDVPWIKGLSLSADFYRIQQNSLIDAPTAQFVVDHPGFAPGAAIERNAAGEIALIRAPFANFGRVVVDGVDFAVNYDLPQTAWGNWKLRWEGSYINSFEQTGLPGAANLELIRTFQYPAFRCRGSVDWSYRGFGAGLALNYTSSYADTGLEPQREREIEGWATVDFQVSYEFNAPKVAAVEDPKSTKEPRPTSAGATWWQTLLDGTKLTVGLNNVADEDPPFANLVEGYDTALGDPTGRFYYISLRKRF